MNKDELRLLDVLWHLDEDETLTRSKYIKNLVQAEARRRKKDLKATGYEIGVKGQMPILDYMQ